VRFIGRTDAGSRIDTVDLVLAAQWFWHQVQSGAVVVVSENEGKARNLMSTNYSVSVEGSTSFYEVNGRLIVMAEGRCVYPGASVPGPRCFVADNRDEALEGARAVAQAYASGYDAGKADGAPVTVQQVRAIADEHVIGKHGWGVDTECRLYVPCGAEPLAFATSDAVGPGWCVYAFGIAEHLGSFPVRDAAAAMNALQAIGYAYEAGGGQ
jgi:hypothetical protein